MAQPTPPGDIPLIEGLGPEWNEFVSAIPEDRRAELGPKLKAQIDTYEPYKQWDDLQRSGITAEQASQALNVFQFIEDNPKQVYDALAAHLNISPQQAKEVVEEFEETVEEDPRIKTIQQQVETLAKIMLTQREQGAQQQLLAEEDARVDRELKELKKKYSDVDEREIIMRMMHGNMSAEEAYKDYSEMVTRVRSSRPAPVLLGNGGGVPRNAIDPTKLDSAGTRQIAAQMLEHARNENR